MQETPKPKRSKKLKLIIILIVGFFVLVAAGASENTSDTPQTAQTPPNQPTEHRDPVELNVSVSHDDVNIVILNKETKDLGNCRLKLNDDYAYDGSKRYLVNAGQEVKIGFTNFTKKDGTRFNVYATKPKYLRIDCDRKDGDAGSADIFWQ
jgi:hypothetical protein